MKQQGLGDLVAQIKHASENIERCDSPMNERIAGIEKSITPLQAKGCIRACATHSG